MRSGLLIALCAATTPMVAVAQSPPAPIAPPVPRLVVAISIDQFSADLFSEYRPLYTSGLKRLETGNVFPAGYQSHAATETCPGHATILTGSHPARTGIIANEWFEPSIARADKKVYCTEDPSVPGSSSSNYTVSPQFLKAQTLGDRMKALNPNNRVVSVAGKDRAAIMMGGHVIDQPWFWAGKAYVTLPGSSHPAPATVEKINAAVTASMSRPSAAKLPDACRAHASTLTVAEKDLGGVHDRKAGDFVAFRTSLEFDRATTDLAIGLINEMKLGQGAGTDVLSIGLSATDYVGHTFGTEGAEMCAQVLSVDDNVGRILTALDATHAPYVVVLTADHGGHDLPERNRIHGLADAVRVDTSLLPSVMGKQLAAEFGLKGPVLMGAGPFGDVYLASGIPDSLRPRVLEAARAHYMADPLVAGVFTAAELRHMPVPNGPADEWSLGERFKVNFDPDRSGDLLVALKPHVTPIPDPHLYVATHGSPWNYDRRVPILFYRPGQAGYEQPNPIETVDILPTLAALIGLNVPRSEIDGRCIDLGAGKSDTCHQEPH